MPHVITGSVKGPFNHFADDTPIYLNTPETVHLPLRLTGLFGFLMFVPLWRMSQCLNCIWWRDEDGRTGGCLRSRERRSSEVRHTVWIKLYSSLKQQRQWSYRLTGTKKKRGQNSTHMTHVVSSRSQTIVCIYIPGNTFPSWTWGCRVSAADLNQPVHSSVWYTEHEIHLEQLVMEFRL